MDFSLYYIVLADSIALIHLLVVIFAVGGQAAILGGALWRWKWTRNPVFRIAHLLMVGFVAFEAVTGIFCPLTVWEYDLRTLGGRRVDRDLSFVARLARSILFHDFEPWVFTVLHVGFGLLVIVTFLFIPPLFRRRRKGTKTS